MISKIILLITCIMLLVSCGSINISGLKAEKKVEPERSKIISLNACPNVTSEDEIFPAYNNFISGMLKTSTAITSKMTKSIDIREPQIAFINSTLIQTKLLNQIGNTIIIVWSTYYTDLELDFTEINKLFNNNNNNIYLICTDLCSDAQIKLIKKYYESKLFFEKSYLLYYKLDNVLDIKNELENQKQLKQFLYDLVSESDNNNLPYLILADRDQNILYSNSIKNIRSDTIEKILMEPNKHLTNKKIMQNYKSLKEIVKSDAYETENKTFSELKPQINNDSPCDQSYKMSKVILDIDENAEKMGNNRIYDITKDTLKQMLNTDNKRKLIVFWGAWCPATSYEIEKFKELCPINNEYSTYFISVDCNTIRQKNVIRAFYNKLNINCDAYIFDIVTNSPNNWMDKVQNNLIDFIKVFDMEFTEFTLPYTAVLDENNNMLYSKWCLPPFIEEEVSIDKAKYLENNAKNDFHKIKSLLQNKPE